MQEPYWTNEFNKYLAGGAVLSDLSDEDITDIYAMRDMGFSPQEVRDCIIESQRADIED